MSCGIIARGDLVAAATDHPVAFDDHGPKRPALAAAHLFNGKSDGFPHKLFIHDSRK
jgi:hypothetical protein